MSSLSSCHWIEQLSFQEQQCSKQMRAHIQAQAQKEEWVLRLDARPLGPSKTGTAPLIPPFPYTLESFQVQETRPSPCASPSPLTPTQKQGGRVCWALLALGSRLVRGRRSSWGWAGKGADDSDRNKGCIRHRGIRCLSAQGLDTILHKGTPTKQAN